MAAAEWMVVPSPNPGVTSNELSGVAVIAPGAMWAVGDEIVAGGSQHTLTLLWNGIRWDVVTSPNPSFSHNVLTSVTATSPRSAWAVGWRDNTREVPKTLTLHWNGTTWTTVESPNFGDFGDREANFLFAVDAVSDDDVWAVGQGGLGTLILHFDGSAWSVVPSPSSGPNLNQLDGVAAVSANDVWAVGTFQDTHFNSQALIEHWDGNAWSIVDSPAGASMANALNAVAAIATDDVWAVGQHGNVPLIEHWNGRSWRVSPSPAPATANSLLRGVSAASRNNVWAVGFDVVNGQTLIEHWNGTTWAIAPSPNPGSPNNILNAVASQPTGPSWAVGVFTGSTGSSETLIEFHP
jgi:hypothetical protein